MTNSRQSEDAARWNSPSRMAESAQRFMGPRDNPRHEMFRYHNCAQCQNGLYDCRRGNPRQCEFPHARND